MDGNISVQHLALFNSSNMTEENCAGANEVSG